MATRTRPRSIATVTIIAKPRAAEARLAARRCALFLEQRGVAVVFDPETARALGRRRDARAPGGTARSSDLYVVIGGDGTLLMAARYGPGVLIGAATPTPSPVPVRKKR